jgi:hypothetical protein
LLQSPVGIGQDIDGRRQAGHAEGGVLEGGSEPHRISLRDLGNGHRIFK